MEENNTTAVPNKLSYEQLDYVASQLQQRAMQAESRLNAINMTTMRLEYLFKVINSASHFPDDFCKKCVNEIMDILEIKDETPKEADSFIDFSEE